MNQSLIFHKVKGFNKYIHVRVPALNMCIGGLQQYLDLDPPPPKIRFVFSTKRPRDDDYYTIEKGSFVGDGSRYWGITDLPNDDLSTSPWSSELDCRFDCWFPNKSIIFGWCEIE